MKTLLTTPRLTDYKEWIKSCNGESDVCTLKWSTEYKNNRPAWMNTSDTENWSMHDSYLEFNKCTNKSLNTRSIHYDVDEDSRSVETYGTVEISLKNAEWLGKVGNKLATVNFENNQLVLRLIKDKNSKNKRPIVYRLNKLEIASTELHDFNNRPMFSLLFQPTNIIPEYIELLVQADNFNMTIIPDEPGLKPVHITHSIEPDYYINNLSFT